jgi:hypothetical protein
MTAFIEINPKSNKGGQIFINDEVMNINDCHEWFDLNREYLEKAAKRRTIANVRMYVKEGYNIIDSYTIQ